MYSLRFLLIFASIAYISCYRILVLFPITSRSHHILGSRLVDILVARGHDVTYVSAFSDGNLPKNCTEVFLDGLEGRIAEMMKSSVGRMLDASIIEMEYILSNFGIYNTELALAHPKMQPLLDNQENHFDLIVMEQFVNNALRGFGHFYKAPIVIFSTLCATSWVNPLLGNPEPWAYVPHFFLPYSGSMTFWQRLHNAYAEVGQILVDKYYFLPKMDEIMHKHFPDAPNLSVLDRNISLALMNVHVSTNQPLPFGPNTINIGGYHVNPSGKLPDDLEKFLNGSKDGVVYFSMGSTLKSRDLPPELITGILNAFAKLKQNVLWKWEGDLPGKPKNVMVRDWLPQEDILGHPNVKLFITHGGLLSTIEAIYHGVPVIGIPVFGDQHINMANAVTAGFCIRLELAKLSEDTLTAALKEIFSNPKYSENAKRRSRLMRDRENNPKDSAAYWIEYVIRNNGASDLRSPSLDLAWYQLWMLDVMLFVIVSLIGVGLLIKFVLKKLKGIVKKKKID